MSALPNPTPVPAVLRSVAYVEDDLFSREVMAMLLGVFMAIPTVTILEDSRDFLARVQATAMPPDIFLLDIHVKPLSGFEMLAELRASPFRDSIVVALTASVMSEEVQQLREAGFDGVIAKPVDMDRFPEQIARLLRKEPVWGIV